MVGKNCAFLILTRAHYFDDPAVLKRYISNSFATPNQSLNNFLL